MNFSSPSAETEPSVKSKDSSTAVAIVLPALFAIVLVLLVAVAYLIPRFVTEETPASKEERRKKRLAELESSWKAQHFVEWAAKQRDEHPEAASTVHALCVICLDDFSSASQIRALGCLHVFHQECLDDWFGRWNEYCPLCHRPILESLVAPKKTARERERQPTVGFLV